MRKLVVTLLLLAPLAWSICSLPPPVEDRYDFPAPVTPPGTPTPTPTPAEDPRGPDTGRPPRGAARTGARTAGASYAASWRIWWELNREHLLGLRQTIRSKDVVSGGSDARSAELLAAYRVKVRAALRKVADKAKHNGVRAAALRALGRAGDDEDARRFLDVLRARQQRKEIYESAAIGLGCLPRVDAAALKDEVRGFMADLLNDRVSLPSRSRRLALVAVSLRGRDDPMLAYQLAVHKGKSADASALLYACGVTRSPNLVPVLIEAVKGGRLNGDKLSDIARSHAALGLALTGEPSAVSVLAPVLASRRVRTHTRRSTALAIGLLMRSDQLSRDQRMAGEHALARALDRDRDPLVRGYAAVGMGTAHRPFGVAALRDAVKSSDIAVRPYAALALGLAARRHARPAELYGFLLDRLRRSREMELTAALSMAAGISGATEARDDLFARLRRKRLTAGIRAPAIQALGLLRMPTTEIEQALIGTLDDESDTVVEDTCLALGFLGRRHTARLLVEKLVRTRSESVQVHMVAALSHLGSTVAIDSLIDVLRNTSLKHTMRESAASALGILVDDRAHDPLFELDAHTNPYCLTTASRALVLVY